MFLGNTRPNSSFTLPVGKVEVKPSLSMSRRHIGGVLVRLHLFFTSAVDPGLFTPKTVPCYPLNRRLGVSQSWSGHFGGKKISCLSVLELRVIQSVG